MEDENQENEDPIGRQFILFVEYAYKLRKKCLQNKDYTKSSSITELYNNGVNSVEVYFNADHSSYCLRVSGLVPSVKYSIEYSDYKNSVEITNCHDNLIESIVKSNNVLKELFDNIDNVFQPKRRSLNFMK